MVLEEVLGTYGVLGLWTGYMIWKETTLHQKLISTLADLKDEIQKGRINR